MQAAKARGESSKSSKLEFVGSSLTRHVQETGGFGFPDGSSR